MNFSVSLRLNQIISKSFDRIKPFFSYNMYIIVKERFLYKVDEWGPSDRKKYSQDIFFILNVFFQSTV